MTELSGYELSRAWFNFCFDNPERVKPVHSAIYYFAIEHCNRLGWKEKFGFPSQMVMEAIGVKNWRTYSKALNEVVDFGFIKMIEISKNQYSSNIIAIVKNTKAHTKALDKALSMHSQKQHTKQGQSTVSIIKQLNKEQLTIEQITILEGIITKRKLELFNSERWRDSFGVYLKGLSKVHLELKKNQDWISTQEKFNPNLNILLSIEKAITNFWGTEAGWKHKKKSKSKEIDWKSTLTKAIDMNKVYKPRDNGNNKTGNGGSKIKHKFNIIKPD